jgi:uncharacterized protein YbaA (DUF1428 family)
MSEGVQALAASVDKLQQLRNTEAVLASNQKRRRVFKSRTHRDEVNAKVMKDPRLAKTDPNAMPFDCKRMAYGAFEVLVDAIAPVPDKSSVLSHDRSQTRDPTHLD